MTLEEAIKIIEGDFAHRHPFCEVKVTEAKRLLIEAGKRIDSSRQVGSYHIASLLSGETKD